MSDDEKQIDKSSPTFKDGYKEGYQKKDENVFETLLDPFSVHRLIGGDDYKAGEEEGQKDRDNNDLQDFKNDVRKDNDESKD